MAAAAAAGAVGRAFVDMNEKKPDDRGAAAMAAFWQLRFEFKLSETCVSSTG